MNECSDWDECIEKLFSVKTTPDGPKARSLISTAKGRINFVSKIEPDESNANYIFENYYSSIIELLHALTIIAGYKVGNHICLGYYLRDIVKRQDLFRIFDDLRFKRNSIMYYGRTMDFLTCKKAISDSKRLIPEIEKMLGSR